MKNGFDPLAKELMYTTLTMCMPMPKHNFSHNYMKLLRCKQTLCDAGNQVLVGSRLMYEWSSTDTRKMLSHFLLCSIVHHALKQRQNTGIADIIGIADNVSLKRQYISIKNWYSNDPSLRTTPTETRETDYQCYSSSQNHFSFSFYKVWAQSLQYKFLYSIWILFS